MIKPNWSEISSKIGNTHRNNELNVLWESECHNWLESIAKHLNNNYRIHDTHNFSILTNEGDRYTQIFSSFLERKLKGILDTLQGIALDNGYGKHVVIIFDDADKYYDYVSLFYPDEGEFGLSSGMYINEGYGHFVFPTQEVSIAEPIAVHELTHACLSHLPIPTWLNEGIAVSMEAVLANTPPLFINDEIILKHQKYWNEQTIQEFWSGRSFYASDEGQGLSYHLAHIVVSNISTDFDIFSQFVNAAHHKDAGESAARNHLDISLGHLIKALLGDGNWKPRT